MQCANGGEAAARVLMDLGVEIVFTLTGGYLNHIHQVLEKSDVMLFDTRHEQAATFMADAYARMTGRPGVAMLTAGPGFTNCIPPSSRPRPTARPCWSSRARPAPTTATRWTCRTRRRRPSPRPS